MVVQPERRCLPLEVEGISLHREPRRSRRPGRARQHGSFRSWVTAKVRAAAGRSRAGPG